MNTKHIKHEREKEFARNFFDHNEWEYEPQTFSFGSFKYTPDFYDKRRDVYIEVVGTRQALNHNIHKYAEMKDRLGKRFEIRDHKGRFIVINGDGKSVVSYRESFSFQKEIAKKLGVSVALVSGILNGKRGITWSRAKSLSFFYGEEPEWWMDASTMQIREKIIEREREIADKNFFEN